MTSTSPSFLSVEEAAERLGVCSKTLRRWISSKRFPAIVYSKRVIRIREVDCDRFVEKNLTIKPSRA